MTSHVKEPIVPKTGTSMTPLQQAIAYSQETNRNVDEDAICTSNCTCIHDLPSETLVRIFELFLDHASFLEHYDWLVTLALVCSRWNIMIDETSTLWTRVSSVYTPSHVDAILRKSKNQLLQVHWSEEAHLGVPDNQTSDRTGDWFWNKLHPVVRRWHTLSLMVDTPVPGADSTLALLPEAISLEHIEMVSFFGDRALRYMLQQKPDKLQSLTLVFVNIGSLLPCLHGFTALKLGNIVDSFHNGMDKLRTALVENPGLVHLSLEDVSFDTGSEDSWGPIDLPQLITLHIFSMGEPLIRYVLPAIRAPNLKRLYVSWKFFTVFEERTTRPVENGLELILSTSHFSQTSPLVSFYVAGPRLARWSVERVEITYSSSDCDVKYSVDIEADQRLGSFAHVISSKRDLGSLNSFSTILHISEITAPGETNPSQEGVDYDSEVGFPWIDAVCDCPKTENESTTTVCKELSTPDVGKGTIRTWPFSSARALELSSNDQKDDQTILSMVRARCAASEGTTSDGRSKARPQTLQSLTIRTRDARRVGATVDKLRGMLGSDSVRVSDEKPHEEVDVSDYCGIRELEGMRRPISGRR